MKNFLILYRNTQSAMEAMGSMSKEEIQAEMQEWMKWGEMVGDRMVDFGSPLGGSKAMWNGGCEESTGGPTGYSVLKAENIEEVEKLCEKHPHLKMDGATLFINECFEVG